MNIKKYQLELIFASLFLDSLKYFYLFLPISNLQYTGCFLAVKNCHFLKTYTGLKEKQLSKIAFSNRF